MAVVKIVPMPGPQGSAGSDISLGDLTITSSTDPQEGALTVLEAPGTITIQSPTAPGLINIQSYNGLQVSSHSSGGIYVNGTDQNHKVVTFADLNSFPNSMFQQVRYSPTFVATGLAFTGSGTTYPTYNSYYIKAGKMVSFVIEVDCSTVTNFGTGQFKLQLPFAPAVGYNHFTGWANVDTTVNPDVANGHVILNVDHAGVTDILDLHYLKQAGGANTPIIEGLFLQGTPVTLTTSSKIYINGTYIAA